MDKNGSEKEDYHGNVNSQIYEKYFVEHIIRNLRRKSCIILDNASYHSRVSSDWDWNDRTPANALRDQLYSYLTAHSIPFDPNTLVDGMRKLVQTHLKQNSDRRLEVLAWEGGGHMVLYQPPYHPEFQASEEIWRYCKSHVAHNTTSFSNLSRIKQLVNEGLDLANKSGAWRSACEKADAARLEFAEYDAQT